MPHGPNHGTAELSSLVESGSAVTGDYNTLVIHDSNIVTHDVIHDCDLWDGKHHVTSLSGNFGYLENNAKVLASSVLRITCFI